MRINKLHTSILLAVAVVAVLAVVLVHSSGVLDKTPVVEVQADNCYEKTLRVITDADYMPYSFYDENGEPSGHDVELANMIANRLHMNLELKLMPWHEAIDAINAGEGDVLMTCDYSDTFEGTEGLLKTESTTFDDFTVFSKGKGTIASASELFRSRIAVMEQGNVLFLIKEMGLMDDILTYKNNREALLAVERGEVDCAIMRNTVGTVLIQEIGAKNLSADFSLGQSFMCFDIDPGQPELVKAIDEAISFFKENGEMEALSEKWLTTFVKTYTLWELFAANLWIPITICGLLMAAVLSIYFSRRQRQQERVRQIEAANQAKTQFLFNMSHDLRTPMNAILGFADIAERNIGNDEKVADSVGKIKLAGTQLLKLLNRVLELSRIEAGQKRIEAKPCDIEREMHEMLAVFEPKAKIKELELSSECNIRDRYVLMDPGSVSDIMLNIISNSLKYTIRGSVRVLLEQLDDNENDRPMYRWTVTDTGIGMSQEYQKHIFERFSRERSASVSGIEGTGLGMAAVKELVDLMGGEITVSSVQNEGTTVSVTLPLERSTDVEVKAEEEPEASAYDAEEFFKGKKVLLVEDNELNREIALAILDQVHLDVETAEDGQQAVEIMDERGGSYFDFILMDIQMPVMDGYEATKEIRRMYPFSHIPIIALSANAFEEDRDKSLEAGMDDHVAKPIDVRILLSTLHKHFKE